mgnify:CR=1 FL=1
MLKNIDITQSTGKGYSFANCCNVFVEDCKDASWYDRLYKEGGHIVVKAYDKGRSYKIYILDSSNEDMIVKDVFGPYSAE